MTGATAVEISASIESAIRDAALAPGDPLPPVRTLAADLAVSPATVSRAYAELRRRGLVVTAGRAHPGTPPTAGARRPHPVCVTCPEVNPTSGCCRRCVGTWPPSPTPSATPWAIPTSVCYPR